MRHGLCLRNKVKVDNAMVHVDSIPDLVVSTAIMLSRRYLALVVQVELYTLAWKQ